jgi:hypothetical protein
MRAARTLLALGLLIAGPCVAAAPDPDTIPFPRDSTSQTVVQAWIDRYLPAKGYVVGAWSANVVMLVSTATLQADAWPEVSTEVWTEVLTPQAAKGAGWRAALELDVFACDRNQYRTESTLLFARADRQGGFELAPGEGAWQTPEDGATMDTVVRAACFYAAQQRKPAPSGGPAPSQ